MKEPQSITSLLIQLIPDEIAISPLSVIDYYLKCTKAYPDVEAPFLKVRDEIIQRIEENGECTSLEFVRLIDTHFSRYDEASLKEVLTAVLERSGPTLEPLRMYDTDVILLLSTFNKRFGHLATLEVCVDLISVGSFKTSEMRALLHSVLSGVNGPTLTALNIYEPDLPKEEVLALTSTVVREYLEEGLSTDFDDVVAQLKDKHLGSQVTSLSAAILLLMYRQVKQRDDIDIVSVNVSSYRKEAVFVFTCTKNLQFSIYYPLL